MKIRIFLVVIISLLLPTLEGMKQIKIKQPIKKFKNIKSNYFSTKVFNKNRVPKKYPIVFENKKYSTQKAPQQGWRDTLTSFFRFKKQDQKADLKSNSHTQFARKKFETEQEVHNQKTPFSYWQWIKGLIGAALVGGTVATMRDNKEESILWRGISKKNLTELYFWCGGGNRSLLIPHNKLTNSPNDLKELFKENNIILDWRWKENTWIESNKYFNAMAKKNHDELEQYGRNFITLDRCEHLLNDAKVLLKSFLASNPTELSKTDFIEKRTAIRRLFTYAKLEQVIKENNLSHIHLPQKHLVIKNVKTGEILKGEEASKVIDTIIKLKMLGTSNTLGIAAVFDEFYQYDLFVYAEKNKRGSSSFSTAAVDEITTLLKEAPFDVGYDNIFSNESGDAIIIDTEFKGEPEESSIIKFLTRYK